MLAICYLFSFDPNTGDEKGWASRLFGAVSTLSGTGNGRCRCRRKTPRFTTSPSFDIKMSGYLQGVAKIQQRYRAEDRWLKSATLSVDFETLLLTPNSVSGLLGFPAWLLRHFFQ